MTKVLFPPKWELLLLKALKVWNLSTLLHPKSAKPALVGDPGFAALGMTIGERVPKK